MKRIALTLTLLGSAALAFAAAVRRADDPINKKCPITGKEVVSQHTTEYKKQTIAFCCKSCLDKFEADPEKYIGKVKEFKKDKKAPAEEISLEAPINMVCPVMGKKVVAGPTSVYQKQLIGFCCPNCVDTFEGDPEKYIKKVKEFKRQDKKAPAGEISFDEAINKKCPITGKEVVSQHTTEYKKQTIAFCCKSCLDKFEADPEKYIGKVKEFKKDKKAPGEEISNPGEPLLNR